jgi:protein-disulfide isomerase/uncharacterized membrane protein
MTKPDSAQSIRKGPLWAAITLLTIGLGVAIYGVLVKLRAEINADYSAGCDVGSMSCTAVMSHDEYALVMGIPIALWALPTYLVMTTLAWFGLKGADSKHAKTATQMLVVMGGLTTLYAAYLFYASHVVIDQLCPVCLTMYAVQVGAFVCAVLAAPTSLLDSLRDGARAALGMTLPVMATTAVFVVTLGVSLMWYHHERTITFHSTAQYQLERAESLMQEKRGAEVTKLLAGLTGQPNPYFAYASSLARRATDQQYTEPRADEMETISAEELAGLLEPAPTAPQPTAKLARKTAPKATPKATAPSAQPLRAPRRARRTEMGYSYFEVPVGSDDFLHGPADALVTVVEFADFECAYCKMLSGNLKRLREKYADKVRFVFKYYPMDGTCNPRMGGEKMHPNACHCAKASYCAGKQGKFWEAHDKLFAKQGELEADKVRGYMEDLGLDMSVWEKCMGSSEPVNRIRKDIRIAALAGITGTPRTYINNRLVSGSATVSILDYYIQKAFENPDMPNSRAPAVAPTEAMGAMVKATTTGGPFYIDRFEATIDKQGRAVSLPNVQPASASWFDAKQACEKAGKRMCSEEEWISACTGKAAVDNNKNTWFNDDEIEGTRYPYGSFYEGSTCHDGQKTLTGASIKTGALHGCRTVTGIYDLTGNMNEWIGATKDKASMTGGHFGSGEGAACNRRGAMFGPGNRNNTTGFRCCANAMVKNATTDANELAANPADVVGKLIPDFEVETTEGTKIGPKDWRGKVTYVTFFAYWCGSCKRELPELKLWQSEFGPKGFQVVAIGVDKNSKLDIDFAAKYEPNYTIALDPDAKTMGMFDIAAMPTSFIVDRKGVIQHRIVGFDKNEVPTTKAFVEKLVQSK